MNVEVTMLREVVALFHIFIILLVAFPINVIANNSDSVDKYLEALPILALALTLIALFFLLNRNNKSRH